jgi:hypothetical protein
VLAARFERRQEDRQRPRLERTPRTAARKDDGDAGTLVSGGDQ